MEMPVAKYPQVDIIIAAQCAVLLTMKGKNAPNCMTTVIKYFIKFIKYILEKIYQKKMSTVARYFCNQQPEKIKRKTKRSKKSKRSWGTLISN